MGILALKEINYLAPLTSLTLLILLTVPVYSQSDGPLCPKLSIVMPHRMLWAGESFEFQLMGSDAYTLEKAKIKWTVSSGTLTSGSDPAKAFFSSTRVDAGSNIKISVSVTNLPNNCSALISDIFGFHQIPEHEDIDSFGKLSPNVLRGRLDGLFATLMTSKYQGILQIHFGDRSSNIYKIARIRLILDHIKFRKFDPKRISFYLGPAESEERTVMRTTPPGIDFQDIGIQEKQLIRAEEMFKRIKTIKF